MQVKLKNAKNFWERVQKYSIKTSKKGSEVKT
jgi:hypothetical protein